MSNPKKHDHDDYKFLRIIDAMASINQKVNLIGVITEIGISKQSKGTDCCCTLKIVDESNASSGISINFFAENFEKLPCVESAGDIIQLVRVVVKSHQSGVNVLFNKKFSSFAIYEGREGSNFVPYQVSSKFQPRDQDRKFIAGLRKWTVGHQPDIDGERILFVWDGTDAPPVNFYKRLDEELENPLPLQLESTPLSRNVLRKFPTVIAKFRCVVRVVATLPAHPRDFQAPCGTYRLRLTLEDPTARIHAYLYAEDGVKFFGGYPSTDTMIKMHNALLGVEETDDADSNEKPRNPPWVDCCLNSYNIDENDVWGSIRYRIFATMLKA